MVPRSDRFALPFLALMALSISIAAAAPTASLPLWAPGDPDPTYPFSDRYPVAIIVGDETDARAVVDTGIDVESVGPTDEGWLIQANINDAERNFLGRKGREIRKLRNLALETARSRDRAWPTWAEYEAWLQATAAAHPDVMRLVSIGTSVQGRNLWFVKISDNPDVEEDEPEFKYSSSIHGDEVTGFEMCRRLITLLTDNYGTDPTLTSYVNEMEIWICPMHNPDGFVAVTRYNAHGVDLNRTFPDPVTDPNDDPTGREPEVQAFMYFGYDHRFILSANYHGGALVVNYPWDCQATYTPDDAMIHNFSLGYAIRNPPMYNNPQFPQGNTIGWAWYIIHGGMQDWCYNWRSDIDVTIECSNTKWPNWSLMDQFWNENRDAMLWYMSRVLTGVRGIVTDANTGQPLDATIDIAQIGKTIRTDPDVGDYERMLLPGTYTMAVTASGYLPQTITGITVVDGPATRRDVAMQPLPTYQITGTVTEEGTGLALSGIVEARRHDTGEWAGQAATNPATGAYTLSLSTSTYDLRATAAGHTPVSRTIVLDQNLVENFVLPANTARILVVQDAATTRIASDLAALGLQTTVETSALTDPSSWATYRLVVWSAGAAADPIVDPVKRQALENYVTGGGLLLIEGGQIGYDVFRTPGYPTFGQNVLHCSDWHANNAGPVSIAAGQEGHAIVTTPHALPAQFAISYVASGDEDAVLPRAEATLIYKTQSYPNDGGIVVFDDSPQNPARGQVVFYAFNYDKLTDAVNARHLLENSIAYLNRSDPAGAAEHPPAQPEWVGPAYPNPARGSVRFAILPTAGALRFEIYDLQGRRVFLREDDSGVTGILQWNGATSSGSAAPTGVYFMRLSAGARSANRPFLWLRP